MGPRAPWDLPRDRSVDREDAKDRRVETALVRPSQAPARRWTTDHASSDRKRRKSRRRFAKGNPKRPRRSAAHALRLAGLVRRMASTQSHRRLAPPSKLRPDLRPCRCMRATTPTRSAPQRDPRSLPRTLARLKPPDTQTDCIPPSTQRQRCVSAVNVQAVSAFRRKTADESRSRQRLS